MNSIEKEYSPENLQKTYDQILEKHQEEGKELDERFAIQIQQAQEGCFNYLKVSSPEELIEKLKSEQAKMLKGFPAFRWNIGLEGYRGEIGAFPGGEERYIYLSREKNREDGESQMKEEKGVEDILRTIKGIGMPGEKIVGFTWNAKGIEHKGKLLEHDHVGVIVDEEARGEGIGFAMYRIYEKVFGEVKQEITPKLSLLRLYLKLGFVPKKIINPEDGKELPMDIGPAIERYFSYGDEKLPYWVYLEK